MTRDEVRKLLGTPTGELRDKWTYSYWIQERMKPEAADKCWRENGLPKMKPEDLYFDISSEIIVLWQKDKVVGFEIYNIASY